jgi:hypothetical protein
MGLLVDDLHLSVGGIILQLGKVQFDLCFSFYVRQVGLRCALNWDFDSGVLVMVRCEWSVSSGLVWVGCTCP